MPLGAAIAIVYLGVLLVVGLGVYFVVPALSSDIQLLAKSAPRMVQEAQVGPVQSFLARLPGPVRDYVHSLPTTIEANLVTYLGHFLTQVLPLLLSFVAIGALFIVIPVVAAYMLLEAEDVKRTFLSFVPASAREKAQTIMHDLDEVVGGFLRGQIVVAIIIGTLITLLLFALHVRYALLIGVVAGIFDLIPYVGAFAGWLPAFIIALLTNGVWNAIFVTIGIVTIFQLEGHILAPNIVSKSVNLTPLAVILALLLGGELAGIPGLFLAVPVAGVIRVFIVNFRPAPVAGVEAHPTITKAPRSSPLIPWLKSLVRERTPKS